MESLLVNTVRSKPLKPARFNLFWPGFIAPLSLSLSIPGISRCITAGVGTIAFLANHRLGHGDGAEKKLGAAPIKEIYRASASHRAILLPVRLAFNETFSPTIRGISNVTA